MPHLPCDTQDYVMTDRHELLLESQLLLQPLIHLFNMQILNAESTVKSSKLPKNVRVSKANCIQLSFSHDNNNHFRIY